MVGPGLLSSTPGAPHALVAGSVESLARIAAQRVVDVLAFRLKDEWVAAAHVAISGGVVIDAVVEALADSMAKRRVDWERVHFWWTDERYLPEGSVGRYETRSRSAGLYRIGVPRGRIHPIPPAAHPYDETAQPAAKAYAQLLRKYAPHGRPTPMFDLVMLEVGDDGSAAGLFPGDRSLHAVEPVVPVQAAPPPAPLRITMTLPTLSASARVWLLGMGADRADAVRGGLTCHPDDATAPPAGRARGILETLWWLDQHAAKGLPDETRSATLESAEKSAEEQAAEPVEVSLSV